MNAANLEIMTRVLETIRRPAEWVWCGKNRRDIFRGITEEQARQYQLEFGGECRRSNA